MSLKNLLSQVLKASVDWTKINVGCDRIGYWQEFHLKWYINYWKYWNYWNANILLLSLLLPLLSIIACSIFRDLRSKVTILWTSTALLHCHIHTTLSFFWSCVLRKVMTSIVSSSTCLICDCKRSLWVDSTCALSLVKESTMISSRHFV